MQTNERFVALSRLCSVVLCAVGLAVLGGWAFDIPVLKSVFPGLVAMKVNTALGFILCGLALGLKAASGKRDSWQGRVANACATTVVLVGALTSCEYLFGKNWAIDNMLFREAPGAVLTLYPGRMALNTALDFIVLGLALLLLDVELRRGRRPAQFLAAGGGLVALLAFTGYIYGTTTFYFGIGRFTAMALHTTLAFMALSMGILLARPDKGWTALFAGQTVAGHLARRLIPVALATPLLLGWLTQQVERMGFYNDAFGDALVAMGSVVIVAFVIWRTAVSLARQEIERERAEETIRRIGRQQALILGSAHEGILGLDLEGCHTFVNPAAARMLGYEVNELLGRHSHALWHHTRLDGRPYPAEECPIYTAIRDGVVRPISDEVFWRKDGTFFPVEYASTPIQENGRLAGAVVIFHDITERKRLEGEKARLLAIIEESPDFIGIADLQGNLRYHNRAAKNMVGLPENADLSQMKIRDMHPDWAAKLVEEEGIPAILREGSWKSENAVLHRNGTEIPVSQVLVVHRGSSGEPEFISTIMRDITERKRVEAQLRQQQKLASVGTLARGMAHEINNPIMGIMNYAQLIKDKAAGDAALAEFAEEILTEGRRVAEMTHNLLNLTQPRAAHPLAPATPSSLVDSVLAQTARRAQVWGISVSSEIPGDLPPVACRQAQIGQVVMVLLTNAMESFGKGRPDAKNLTPDPASPEARQGVRLGGGDKAIRLTVRRIDKAGFPWLRMTVEDNGPGIPKDIQERVFDPFFTTKDRTQHPGLGLWIGRTIVQEHGGELTVESEEGKGTRVHVDLPAMADGGVAATDNSQQEAKS